MDRRSVQRMMDRSVQRSRRKSKYGHTGFKHSSRALLHKLVWYFVLFSAACVVCGAVFIYSWYVDQDFSSQIEKLSDYRAPKHSVFYDAHNRVIKESYGEFRKHIAFADIPEDFIHAITSIEDKNFFSHAGVDFLAIVRAALKNIRSGKITQGGSTITQQLVRYNLLSQERSYLRKIREVILAWLLERKLSKEQIMELYANTLFLGSNAYGIASASLRFFARPIHKLDLHELALIAGLFQAPSRYNPYNNRHDAIRRQRQVLRAMFQARKITRREMIRAMKSPLTFGSASVAGFTGNEGYFIDYVEAQAKEILKVFSLKNRGYSIYTSIDLDVHRLTRKAVKNMESKFAFLEKHNSTEDEDVRLEASAVVMNMKTGYIEAMLGGRDYDHSHFNRAFQALRAPGSAFKPVVYSYALTQGYRWSDVFFLSPITLGGTYRPRSLKSQYLKESTLLKSFYNSVNMTSIEVGKKLGMLRIIEHAKRLGILSPIKQEYGSLIGQSEVTVLDMLRMYSTFAAGGQMVEPAAILRIVDSRGKEVYRAPSIDARRKRVLPENVNYLMLEGMRKVLSHGTARRAYALADFAAGKTGTTNNSVDNWFCGFTQDYAMVVWVGVDVPKPLLRGENAGATLALPIWSSVMKQLSEKAGTKDFPKPSGVKRYYIDPRFGHISKAGVEAWFLNGSSPPVKPSVLTLIHNQKRKIRGFGSR